MQEDFLEKYIAEHKGDFDTKNPPLELWDNIEKHLPEKRNNRFVLMKIAAVGLILFVVGLGVGSYMFKNTSSHYADVLPPEFVDIESYYAKQVSTSYQELQTIGIDENIEQDIKALDEIYGELKQELLDNQQQNKEQIMNAMITNYKTKAELLQKIVERLKGTEAIQNINKDDIIEI